MLELHLPTERLSKIIAPTLVLMGEEDPAPQAASLTQSKMPGAQLVIIPGAVTCLIWTGRRRFIITF
jgi:pimeloyl-ACP methyl ester carboxylesterase